MNPLLAGAVESGIPLQLKKDWEYHPSPANIQLILTRGDPRETASIFAAATFEQFES
jgi:hypothetical protein